MSRFPFYRRRPGIHKRASNEQSRPAERVANFPDAFAQSRQRGHSVTYKLLMTSGRSLARGINYTARRRRRRECPALHVVTGGYHGHFDRNDDTDATSPLHVSASGLHLPPLSGHYLQASRFRMKNRQTTPV